MGGCSHRVLIAMHIFLSAFDEVPDPRVSNVRHDLGELLVIAFVSVLCGSTSCAEMAAFGRAKESFFKNFLKLKHAIPSHDTFSEVFRIIVSDGHAPLIFALRSVVRSNPGGFERLRAHRGVPDVLIVMPFCACA